MGGWWASLRGARNGGVLEARHRHTVSVRTDGLQVVLGRLADDRRVQGAALVDVDSGMVLDAWSAQWGRADTEIVGALHAEIVRVALGPPGRPAEGAIEVVLSRAGGRHDIVRSVPDPHGDRLALSVVVVGPRRVLERTRRRLRVVSESALTAGPSMARRPGTEGWTPPVAQSPVAQSAVAQQSPVAQPPAARSPIPGSPPGSRQQAPLAPRDPAIMTLSVGRALPRPAAPPDGLRAVPHLLDPHPPETTEWTDRPPAPLPALAPAPPRRDPGPGGGHVVPVRRNGR